VRNEGEVETPLPMIFYTIVYRISTNFIENQAIPLFAFLDPGLIYSLWRIGWRAPKVLLSEYLSYLDV